MKIREKRRLTQNKGVSVKIRQTWQVCKRKRCVLCIICELNMQKKRESVQIIYENTFFILFPSSPKNEKNFIERLHLKYEILYFYTGMF